MPQETLINPWFRILATFIVPFITAVAAIGALYYTSNANASKIETMDTKVVRVERFEDFKTNMETRLNKIEAKIDRLIERN